MVVISSESSIREVIQRKCYGFMDIHVSIAKFGTMNHLKKEEAVVIREEQKGKTMKINESSRSYKKSMGDGFAICKPRLIDCAQVHDTQHP
jgi:hypothetical protein